MALVASATFQGRRLKAVRPPEPEEVYWDQLQVPRAELVKRQLAASAALVAPMLLGTAAITFANAGMSLWVRTAESVLAMIGLQAAQPPARPRLPLPPPPSPRPRPLPRRR